MIVYKSANNEASLFEYSSGESRRRQEDIDADTCRQQDKHHVAVSCKYPKTEFKNGEQTHPQLPFPISASANSNALGQYLDTSKKAMTDILSQADPLLVLEGSSACHADLDS